MTQKMYFTVNGERVQQIFNDGGVEFSLPYLAQVLQDVKVRGDYAEYEYGEEVTVPVTALLRYIEGASVEVVSQ